MAHSYDPINVTDRINYTSMYATSQESPIRISPLEINNIKISPSKTREALPLFNTTCDNIAYSGVIETQAINVLTDVKQFIIQLTDPVVSINKFETLIFLYSLGKCLNISIENEFDLDCSEQTPGKTCPFQDFLKAVAKENNIAKVAGDIEIGDAASGGGTNIEVRPSKAGGVISRFFEQKDDWFDKVMICVGYERTMILKFLDDIFTKNWKLKSSIIDSISTKCSVALKKNGDPTNMSEIYKLNQELLGNQNNSDEMEADMNTLTNPTATPGDTSIAKNNIYGRSFCIDGMTANKDVGCKTSSQRKVLKYMSSQNGSINYNIDLARRITSAEYDSNDTYTEMDTSTFTPTSPYTPTTISTDLIKQTLQELAPRSATTPADTSRISGIISDLELENLITDYWNLKKSLNVGRTPGLNKIIDLIFHKSIEMSYQAMLPDGTTIPVKIPVLLENPFVKDMFHSGIPAFEDNVLMKTNPTSGATAFLSIKNIFDNPDDQKRVVEFYRSLIAVLIYVRTPNPAEKETNLIMYKSTHMVPIGFVGIVELILNDFVEINSLLKYDRIFGSDNSFTQNSRVINAIIEKEVIKMRLERSMINRVLGLSDQNQLPKLIIIIKNPDIEYLLNSNVDDYFLPRFQDPTKKSYKKTKAFFSMLSSIYKKEATEDNINNIADKVEDFKSMSKIDIYRNSISKMTEINAKENSLKNQSLIIQHLK